MQCKSAVIRPIVCLTVVLEEGEQLTLQKVLDQVGLDVPFDPETQQVVSFGTGECDLDAVAVSGVYYLVPKVVEEAGGDAAADTVVTETKDTAVTAGDPPPVADPSVVEEPVAAAAGAVDAATSTPSGDSVASGT